MSRRLLWSVVMIVVFTTAALFTAAHFLGVDFSRGSAAGVIER